MISIQDAIRRNAREVLRRWRAEEAKLAEGRLRDLKHRLTTRLDRYQRTPDVKRKEQGR